MAAPPKRWRRAQGAQVEQAHRRHPGRGGHPGGPGRPRHERSGQRGRGQDPAERGQRPAQGAPDPGDEERQAGRHQTLVVPLQWAAQGGRRSRQQGRGERGRRPAVCGRRGGHRRDRETRHRHLRRHPWLPQPQHQRQCPGQPGLHVPAQRRERHRPQPGPADQPAGRVQRQPGRLQPVLDRLVAGQRPPLGRPPAAVPAEAQQPRGHGPDPRGPQQPHHPGRPGDPPHLRRGQRPLPGDGLPGPGLLQLRRL